MKLFIYLRVVISVLSALLTSCGGGGGSISGTGDPPPNPSASIPIQEQYSQIVGGCVADSRNGLIWEEKTSDRGLRDVSKKYTNFTQAFDPSSVYGTAGDASGYITAVNASNLCGYADWRLPTAQEIQGLASYSAAELQNYKKWFPNVAEFGGTLMYWSDTAFAGNSYSAWIVFFNAYGFIGSSARANNLYVRLVRTSRAQPVLRFLVSSDGREVTDTRTNRIWQRCSEGKDWNGITCAGIASPFTQAAALLAAQTKGAITGMLWRLPNVKELSSIVERSSINPAVDSSLFPATPSDYFWWTSTANELYPGDSNWVVDFAGGGVYDGNQDAKYVRLVRNAP